MCKEYVLDRDRTIIQKGATTREGGPTICARDNLRSVSPTGTSTRAKFTLVESTGKANIYSAMDQFMRATLPMVPVRVSGDLQIKISFTRDNGLGTR